MRARLRTAPANHRSVAAGALFGLALCASPDARAEPTAPPTGPEMRPPESYRFPLALGYVLAPALAGSVGAGIFELTDTEHDDIHTRRNVAIGIGSLMFLLPAAVHLHYTDAERALPSLGSMLGVTLAGAAVLGGLGYLLGKASCDESDPYYEAEGCDFVTGSIALIGAATGATLGYAGYAIYDVITNAERPAPNEATRLELWLAPIADSSPDGATRLGGMRLGGTVRF
jgi:hypothetical protein